MADLITLLFLAVGLSMDAFAVSVCKGLSLKKANFGSAVIVGLWFGAFQALMPTIGYFLGQSFHSYITSFDHWIAFILLVVIGANMIRESRKCSCEISTETNPLAFGTMFVMAVATSIDALAVGLSLSMAGGGGFSIWFSAGIIGLVTFCLSFAGVKVGAIFGSRYEARAELAGGIILILIGVKVLVEHLFFQ